jgi:hypothetical protein
MAARRPAWAIELAIGLSTFAAYVAVNAVAGSRSHTRATAHAHTLYAFERHLHIDVEQRLNHWLAGRGWLRVAADYEYATTYVLSAFGLLFWLYRVRPELYPWARRSFVALNLFAMACFLVWPLTPPRLLPGFTDTVRNGHTWGSWGSPLVGHANVVAAMPSLHLGWALWVSAVLAAIAGGMRAQALSAGHVLITLWVIMATGNHFVLDAVAAGIFVWLGLAAAGARPAAAGQPVPATDAFFLHTERPGAPQHVGGVIVVDNGTLGQPTREATVAMLRERLPDLPRLRQCLDPDGGGLRRPRWRSAGAVDPAAHLEVVDVSAAPDPRAAFHAVVARVAERPLPRDQPLWRAVLVPGLDDRHAGFVWVTHHVIADGLGTIAQARRVLDPYPPPDLSAGLPPAPSAALRVGAVAVGLAKLAGDGKAGELLPSGAEGRRDYATATLDLADVRASARAHGVRVTDVLLAATGSAISDVLAGQPDAARRLRTAVPLMVARPDGQESGNFTMAVLVDVPLGPMSAPDRLRAVAAHSGARLRRADRALASRFVLRALGGLTPAPVFRLFARRVYGAPYFTAIVSNMPGTGERTAFLGRPLDAAFPLVPLAPGAPVALGAMSWAGQLCLGLTVDPTLAPAAELMAGLERALDGLRAAQPADVLRQDSASISLRRTDGSSSSGPNNPRS